MLILVAHCAHSEEDDRCYFIFNARKLCPNCPLRTAQDVHFALQTEKDPCHTGPKDRQTTPPASPSES